MRTTVAIDDELLASARRRARQRALTLGQLIESALRRELAADRTSSDRPPIPVFRTGTGPRPGLDLSSNRALAEALDEGVELDGLR
jgi:uncharacterized protein YggE